MTRKRFKKLLMAHGYQSRDAEAMAWMALWHFGEYRSAWHLYYARTARFHLAMTMIRRAAKQAIKAFSAVDLSVRRYGGCNNV